MIVFDLWHRATQPLRTRIRVPAVAVVLLAASALIGNAAQWVDRGDLKAAADESKAETDCRSRIIGYVDGLRINLDIGQAKGLLDRVGHRDDAVFDEAVDKTTDAITQLEPAATIRERATEICARNPDFNPDQIPRGDP